MFRNLFSNKTKKYNHFDLDKHSIDNAELDYWRIVDVSNDDVRLIVRVRTEKPNLPDIDKYNKCVSVTWKYDCAENELPSDEDKQQQDEFEDSLADLTMYNNLSFLMGVSTGLGEKEWVFYVKDTDEFMQIFNDLLKGSPGYPVSIDFYDDENWAAWNEKLEYHQKSEQES